MSRHAIHPPPLPGYPRVQVPWDVPTFFAVPPTPRSDEPRGPDSGIRTVRPGNPASRPAE